MTHPVRIQLSRCKGFDLQEMSRAINGLPAVKVDRSTPFGNHYRVDRDQFAPPAERWMTADRNIQSTWPTKAEAIADSVRRFREDVSRTGPHNSRLVGPVPTRTDIIKALRGRNLACWCALPKPGKPDICHAAVLLEMANSPIVCHADVLLEIANGPLCEEVQ